MFTRLKKHGNITYVNENKVPNWDKYIIILEIVNVNESCLQDKKHSNTIYETKIKYRIRISI